MDTISTKDMESIFNNLGIILSEKHFYVIEAGAGAARVMQHITSGEPFFFINAFKSDEFSHKHNRDVRNKQLMNDIRSKGLSAIQMMGHFIPTGQPDVDYMEDSFFVTNHVRKNGVMYQDEEKSRMDLDEFAQIAQELSEKYRQESYLFGDGLGVYIVETATGKKDEKGKIPHVTIDKIEGAFSEIKGKKFVFSCVMLPKVTGISSATIFESCGYSVFELTENEKKHIIR